MIGGIIVGASGLHLIDAHEPIIHVFAELGVVLLLFLIGLETDLSRLIAVGPVALAVAAIGVVVPFGGGYAVGAVLGYSPTLCIFLGAALTATSVGITARVLSDLGQLKSNESQVILGAAVVDDILGLILLGIVTTLASGTAISILGIGRIAAVAFGFVAAAIVIGTVLAPKMIAFVEKLRVAKAVFFTAIVFGFALAYLASALGSALIIGAFAAGLVLARTDRGKDIEHEVHDVAQFFIPIFFVSVGAAVDVRTLNPFNAEARPFFVVGVLLTVVAILGKLTSALGAFRGSLRKSIIGVGMVPRGEVGLIFAQMGLSAGLLTAGLYSSVAMMVLITTFVTPPALRALVERRPECDETSTLCDLTTEAMSDHDDRRNP
jgi:Kef-type K+ transport system membrane component KefB